MLLAVVAVVVAAELRTGKETGIVSGRGRGRGNENGRGIESGRGTEIGRGIEIEREIEKETEIEMATTDCTAVAVLPEGVSDTLFCIFCGASAYDNDFIIVVCLGHDKHSNSRSSAISSREQASKSRLPGGDKREAMYWSNQVQTGREDGDRRKHLDGEPKFYKSASSNTIFLSVMNSDL